MITEEDFNEFVKELMEANNISEDEAGVLAAELGDIDPPLNEDGTFTASNGKRYKVPTE